MSEQKIKIVKICTVSAVIFILLLLSTLIVNLVSLAKHSAEEKRLQLELKRLNEIIRLNEEEISYKKTDEFVEQYARDEHNMMRKNEEVIVRKNNS